MSFDTPSETVTPHHSQAHIQQARSLRQKLGVGLVAFSLLMLLLALILISNSLQRDIRQSEVNLTVAQEQLLRLSTPAPELQVLITTLTNTQSLADKLASASPPNGIQWPAVVTAINDSDLDMLTLTSLTQVGNRITLTGLAVDDSVVVTYVRRLEASELFTTIILQSLTRVVPTTPADQAAAEYIKFIIVIELSV